MSYVAYSDPVPSSEQALGATLSELGFTALRTIAAHAEQIQQMEHRLALQRERIKELERELVMARRSSLHGTHGAQPNRFRLLPHR